MRVWVAGVSLLLAGCASRDITVRAARPATEAVLVLPGLGYETAGSRDMRRFARTLSREGYDVFVPDIQARRGIDQGVKRLDRYARKKSLARYEKLHVFAYILGGYTLVRYADRMPNLASVVFDRSPLQERAPDVVTEAMPLVARVLMGEVVFELARSESPVLAREDVRVGILIESRATWFIRRHKKRALGLGPVEWGPDAFGQRYDDWCYVWLDHDAMYHRFDVLAPDVIAFFATGYFTGDARKVPFDRDPFRKR